ncbi:GNAT family N-acetyltransferase [Flavobacterium sp. W22_SRS_FP1]|uniref:GNAT family N-acetyltransferase n=1 Tax=Flavobacterium sp. W22_SRS_FP1 TaxID=3240276 RepID=UPI003F931F0C
MLQIFKLDSKEGIENYEFSLSTLNVSEPFFLKEYIDVFCSGTKNLICFFYFSSKNNASAIMPGYLKPIVIGKEETIFYDFITPYGYTGPIFSNNITQSDILDFWELIDQWYTDNHVITEFIRFNLFGNQEHYSGEKFPSLHNIKGNIIDKEDQWIAFDRKVRKNVNKAKREHLTSAVYFLDISDIKISEFYDIYIQTMKRRDTNKSFLYSFQEFKRFINNNEKHSAICTIYFKDIPISSELILISKDSIYSFLGGTDENYFDKRPNDFLKFEVLNWARALGKKHYILGGGYSLEDGIFQYKKGFFPNDVVDFYTGRKILNKKVYDQLVTKTSNFKLSKGMDKLDIEDNTFFPLYRKID